MLIVLPKVGDGAPRTSLTVGDITDKLPHVPHLTHCMIQCVASTTVSVFVS